MHMTRTGNRMKGGKLENRSGVDSVSVHIYTRRRVATKSERWGVATQESVSIM